MSRTFSGLITFGIATGLALGSFSITAKADAEIRALSPKAFAREQNDRDVDRAALSAQDNSIAKLDSLLKKYRGTRQEPILLSKLADLQQQKATILFRIAHGNANRHGKASPLDMSTYHKGLKTSIQTLNQLIAKYPRFEEIPHAYFIRGKAYEEIGDTNAATKDYLHLVKTYPDVEETSPAYMSLAEFAINANNHQVAIKYLEEIEKRPEDAHYPFALYKLAWSHFNLKNISTALSYAEKQIAYYNAHSSKDSETVASNPDSAVTSDSALKENTLLDVPSFYFEGLEGEPEKFPLDNALSYFKKLESGPTYGKMALRFAKLLRSRNRDKDLDHVKDQFLASDSKRPESLEIILLAYEYLQNKRMYAKLVESTLDIAKLSDYGHKNGIKYEGMGKAQKMVLDTAESLQSTIVKNKDTEEAHSLSTYLAQIYSAFTQIVDEKDPRIPQVHYNLAETLFTIHDFTGATENYRWVVEKGSISNQLVAKTVSDSALKAISSRYEVLREKKMIAGNIKAVALSKGSDSPKLDPLISTWIAWIDDYASNSKHDKQLDNFDFEANRTLYAQGDIKRSIKRMEKFARKYPASPYAIPSATLVLDTSIAGNDWESTHDLARSFMKVPEWKKDFYPRVFEVAADSFYKQIEAKYRQKDNGGVLDDLDSFFKDYTGSKRVPDALSLGGAAALAKGDKAKAVAYFTQLIRSDKDVTRVSDAILSRAQIEEQQFDFARSASDYKAYLELKGGTVSKLKSGETNDLRKKVLALSYLSANSGELKSLLKTNSICTSDLESECEKYTVLSSLFGVQNSSNTVLDDDTTDKAFEHSRKASGEARTLWALYALQGAKHLAFRDRNLSLRTVASGWKELDPMAQFALLPLLTTTVPKVFEMNRASMKEVAPLRADERYITRRVEVIREMENAAAKIMDLPWARVRAETLSQTASLYLDLAKGLAEISPPKGLSEQDLTAYNDTIRKLTVPFEEKGQDIRSKAFEIASRFGIEEQSFHTISEPFFAENPSQAKKLKSSIDDLKPLAHDAGSDFVPLDLAYFRTIEKAKKQSDSEHKREKSPQAEALLTAWKKAVQDKLWAQVAFYLQDAREHQLFDGPVLGLIRAVSLSEAGARGEGLAELEDIRTKLDESARETATLTLAHLYAQNFAQSRAKDLYEELAPKTAARLVAEKKASDSSRAPASVKQ